MRTIFTSALLAGAVIASPAAQATQVYHPGTGITNPVVVKEVHPTYTGGAMRRKVQGMVELQVVVLRDGTVRDDVKVAKSLDEELDQQAVAAIKQWQFRPGTKDGEPVNVQVNVEMTFVMRDRAPAAAAPQREVYKVGQDGVKSPVLVHEVKPQYTDDAKARGVQGAVEMDAVVRADGTVDNVRVTKSLDEQLDQQAIAALKQWQFRPGTKDGRSVDVKVKVEMTFTVK